jgi:aspartyl-tRNA(Asn)/glutamyl-tRNA(Gln) amidotransferase subunit B
MTYEAVIGLEIHVQLNTRTKTFCSCSTEYGSAPNSNTCPVCLGLPGALPVLNEEAIRKGISAGLALGCTVEQNSIFARKNYFYPDLPKAYQISQYELPLNRNGRVQVTMGDGRNARIGITRAHLEEDAGKLVHDEDPRGPSYVDFNRCGVPLLEIVTEPDIRTPDEAYCFLTAIKEIMQYTGVSECNMEKGELRVDVNISMRPTGERGLGVKQEIKNMNSFANVKRALEYEIKRQSKLLRGGETIEQQTRLFDPNKNATLSMRMKEEAQDYRYFPDPDLVPVVLSEDDIAAMRESLPELPDMKRKRFVEQYGLTEYDAANLCSSIRTARYFEEAVRGYENPKKIANWMLTELMRYLNEQKIEIDGCAVTSRMLRELFEILDSGVISGKIAKDVFNEMMSSGRNAREIVEEKGLRQVSDAAELGGVIDKVLAGNRSVVDDYLGGKSKAFGFLVGQVMKLTKGTANPKLVNELLRERIGGSHDLER